MPEPAESLSRGGIAGLGPIAEREEGFPATGRRASAGGDENRPSGAWFASRIEVPAPAAGPHEITVSDAWGNAATFMVEVPE